MAHAFDLQEACPGHRRRDATAVLDRNQDVSLTVDDERRHPKVPKPFEPAAGGEDRAQLARETSRVVRTVDGTLDASPLVIVVVWIGRSEQLLFGPKAKLDSLFASCRRRRHEGGGSLLGRRNLVLAVGA